MHGAGLPYGYAVTVWSTGSSVSYERGLPSIVNILLFAAGAAAAYGAVRHFTWGTEKEAERPLTRSPYPIRAGILHVTAIGLAIASAVAIAQIPSDLAWGLASFAATLVYLGVSSVEVALVEREQRAQAGGP
ncbi:MAG: hypothetical protein M3401_18770 [Actinomycetota bacterium]|nr:hypothetical protein [Actinomycetota bacterium]